MASPKFPTQRFDQADAALEFAAVGKALGHLHQALALIEHLLHPVGHARFVRDALKGGKVQAG